MTFRFPGKFIALYMLLLLPFFAAAQTDSLSTTRPLPALRISLLTCGPGSEIYSVFGHTAIRITDSISGSDIVYNYGTFNGYDADFESKFMRGKLLYYLSTESFADFMGLYEADGRKVEEQVLTINEQEKQEICHYLQQNLLPENRAYRYDFFFDNCATRIRDIFSRSMGDHFRYPDVLPGGKPISYRDIINHYLRPVPWERFGINILLGSKIDRMMSSRDIMFLPDYLRDGLAGATVSNKPISCPATLLLEHKRPDDTGGLNPVLITLWCIAALTIAGGCIPSLKRLGSLMSSLLLLLTGLLGVLILFMWFGTDHQTCANNYNLLWALPTNLLFLFRRKAHKYAFIAILLILVSIILHITGIQQLLLAEMTPLLLAQLFIFANIYRRRKQLSVSHA